MKKPIGRLEIKVLNKSRFVLRNEFNKNITLAPLYKRGSSLNGVIGLKLVHTVVSINEVYELF